MKFFVLSLPDSTLRREKVESSFYDAGMEFEFIDAVNGSDGSHPLMNRFRSDLFLRYHGRYGQPGEIGCYASHFIAWSKCVELGEPIVVFEDDFKWSLNNQNLAEGFEAAEHFISEYKFIRLEKTNKRFSVHKSEMNGYSFSRLVKIPQCATCYMISPDAAQAFIDASESFVLPVDVMIRHQHLHRIPVHIMRPALVDRNSGEENPSIIGKRPRKAPMLFKFTRQYYRIKFAFLNFLTNLRYRDLFF